MEDPILVAPLQSALAFFLVRHCVYARTHVRVIGKRDRMSSVFSDMTPVVRGRPEHRFVRLRG